MKIIDDCPNGKIKLYLRFFAVQTHEWKVEDIGVHMAGVSDTFIVRKVCKCCGKLKIEHFVEYETLMRIGYSKDELQTALRREI